MSRISKYLLVSALIVFVLACNLINRPINDVQNLAQTAEALATSIPSGTLQALPSFVPSIEALASALPDFENFFDPQGTPAAEWKGIPIMPQATAGQEFQPANYSFRAPVTVEEARVFYDEQMVNLGWSTTISMPGDANGALLVFSKDSSILTITITAADDTVVVLLTLA